MELRHAALTETGPVRPRNEDHFGVHLPARLFVVADGMGGHERGDLASKLAVRSVEQHFEQASIPPAHADDESTASAARDLLIDAIRAANHRVYGQPSEGSRARRMGATLVALHLTGRFAVVAHAGDCRCYRLRSGELEQLTRDHSLVNDIQSGRLDVGEPDPALLAAYSHVVTRAVGIDAEIEVEGLVTSALPDDVFLLCSDGVSGVVNEEQLLECIDDGDDLETRCRVLISAATQAGSKDNMTVLLVAVDS